MTKSLKRGARVAEDLRNRIEALSESVEAQSAAIESLQADHAAQAELMAALEERLEALSAAVEAQSGAIESHQADHAAQARLMAALEERLEALSDSVEAQSAAIESHQADHAAQAQLMAALEERLEALSEPGTLVATATASTYALHWGVRVDGENLKPGSDVAVCSQPEGDCDAVGVVAADGTVSIPVVNRSCLTALNAWFISTDRQGDEVESNRVIPGAFCS